MVFTVWYRYHFHYCYHGFRPSHHSLRSASGGISTSLLLAEVGCDWDSWEGRWVWCDWDSWEGRWVWCDWDSWEGLSLVGV